MKAIRAPGSAIVTSPRLANTRARRRRRVRHDDDHRHARVVEVLDRDHRLRQLHQREDPLLHARPARARDGDERDAAIAPRSQARENFSPTALPIEPPMNAKSMTASSTGAARSPRGRSPSPRPARSSSPPRPAARRTAAGRRSRAGRPSGRPPPPRERARVGELLDPRAGAHREMVAALRADAKVLVELVVAVVRAAVRTGVRVLLGLSDRLRRVLVLDRHVDVRRFSHRVILDLSLAPRVASDQDLQISAAGKGCGYQPCDGLVVARIRHEAGDAHADDGVQRPRGSARPRPRTSRPARA